MASDLEAQLAAFRAAHRPLRARLAGAVWSYYVCGAGPEPLLLLPGAPGVAEMAFPYLLAFAPRYRVVAPSYPATVGSLAQLLAGLDALVAAELPSPFHMVGASYSGLVAQVLLRRAPERVRSLLIGDTGVARPDRARAMAPLGAALSRLPPAALHLAIFAVLAVVLGGDTPAHRFWRRYFRGVVAGLTGRELANRVGVMVEIDRLGQRPPARPAWGGPTLLFENTLDPLFAPRERAALRASFPQAVLHTINSRSHITALTRSAEYIGVMEAFLAAVSRGA